MSIVTFASLEEKYPLLTDEERVRVWDYYNDPFKPTQQQISYTVSQNRALREMYSYQDVKLATCVVFVKTSEFPPDCIAFANQFTAQAAAVA